MDSRPHLYNTLTRTVEPFEPLSPTPAMTPGDPGWALRVRPDGVRLRAHRKLPHLCVCRPRPALPRVSRGFGVVHVMNITDVEDKIIQRVRETGLSFREFTGATKRNSPGPGQPRDRRPEPSPRATEHIPQIIELIRKLEQRGWLTGGPDGSVYFSIEKYRGCGCRAGQLVNLNLEAQRVGERVASDEYDKESVADFAPWKARVPEDSAVFWESPGARVVPDGTSSAVP